MYINLDTGTILTRREMLIEAEEVYGLDEWTPASELYNYYDRAPAGAKTSSIASQTA